MAEERAVTPPGQARPKTSDEAAARVDALRQRIDALDEEIVKLLSARAA